MSAEARALLHEVLACFTRDDDLPNDLLPRIDSFLTYSQPAAPAPLTDEWVACIKRPVVVHVRAQRNGEVDVSTREGITPVAPDDLIMRGVDGEVYPICRPVFERTYDLLSDKQATPAQPAAPAEGDSLLGRAFSDCAAADCFEDGVSADLHSSGIETLSDAWLAGREDFICEVRATAAAMPAAAKQQPAASAETKPNRVSWPNLCRLAQEIVESKSLWKRFIDGTPLANDIAVWMADFAFEHAALAQPAAPATSDLHPRTAELVQRFAVALAEKLSAAEKKYGYSDKWAEPDWMDECRAKLIEHVAKGDPRDVAAYCAFLWHHGERTALAQSAQAEPVAWMVYTQDGKSVFVTDNPTDIPPNCTALPLFTESKA